MLAAGIAPAAMLAGRAATAAGVAPAGPSQPPRYVPIPERARTPAIPSKGYLLDDLGGGLYGVRFGGSQSMFLVTRTGVVVVDAPYGGPVTPGARLMAAIREVTDRRVTHFVYSHAHADHVGAASTFGPKVQYVAHELTANLLRKAKDPRRPVPTLTFAGKRHVLKVGGERLVLDYHGNVHQEGNIFIYAPEQRTLMLVDVIAPRWAPYFQLALSHHVPFYMEVVNKIIPAYDFKTFIGGHRGWYGTRADIEEHGRYMADLEAATRKANDEVDADPSVYTRGIDPDNGWAISQVLYNAVADRAAELMPTSWLTRLGGADVFLRENTHAMAYSVVID